MTPGMRVGAFMGAYFASIALTAFMPLFYADRGLSAEDIDQVLGTATFLRILSGPGWGNAADRFGRRRPVLLLAGLLVVLRLLGWRSRGCRGALCDSGAGE